MIVEVFDTALGQSVHRLPINPPPFLQAAERGCIRIMRIERQKHQLIKAPSLLESSDGGFGERIPVAHGGHGDRIDVGFKRSYEADALPLREKRDGRAAAN